MNYLIFFPAILRIHKQSSQAAKSGIILKKNFLVGSGFELPRLNRVKVLSTC